MSRQEVVVADIKIPFWSMVEFLVMLAIAAIPAMIILAIVGFGIFMALAALGGLSGLATGASGTVIVLLVLAVVLVVTFFSYASKSQGSEIEVTFDADETPLIASLLNEVKKLSRKQIGSAAAIIVAMVIAISSWVSYSAGYRIDPVKWWSNVTN